MCVCVCVLLCLLCPLSFVCWFSVCRLFYVILVYFCLFMFLVFCLIVFSDLVFSVCFVPFLLYFYVLWIYCMLCSFPVLSVPFLFLLIPSLPFHSFLSFCFHHKLHLGKRIHRHRFMLNLEPRQPVSWICVIFEKMMLALWRRGATYIWCHIIRWGKWSQDLRYGSMDR